MIESFHPYYKTNTFELPLSAYKTGFLYKHDEAVIVWCLWREFLADVWMVGIEKVG
jgi:hypothetical protein